MSISLVVTRGFGNGTLSGTIKGVVLRGYTPLIPSPSTARAESIVFGRMDNEVILMKTDTELVAPLIDGEVIYNG